MPTPYDLRLDIPARAMLDAQILQRAEETGSLDQSKVCVLRRTGVSSDELSGYSVLDQAHIAGLLYNLLVVPKERLKLHTCDPVFTKLDDLKVARHFKIIEQPDQMRLAPSYWLLRVLRNSIAHVLYEIDSCNNWEFWTDKAPIWQATASRASLLLFLTEAGQVLANHALLLKRTD